MVWTGSRWFSFISGVVKITRISKAVQYKAAILYYLEGNPGHLGWQVRVGCGIPLGGEWKYLQPLIDDGLIVAQRQGGYRGRPPTRFWLTRDAPK